MNCKPGDLAVMTHVKDAAMAPNVGQIVEVIRFSHDDREFGPRWWVRVIGLGRICDMGTIRTEVRPEGTFPDRYLRPITGLPLDEDVSEDLKVPA